jgi:hypothetical protein
MVTVAADAFSSDTRAQLKHLAHVALHVQSASDDSQIVRLSTDPQSCCGLISQAKFSLPGTITLPQPEPMLLMVCAPC